MAIKTLPPTGPGRVPPTDTPQAKEPDGKRLTDTPETQLARQVRAFRPGELDRLVREAGCPERVLEDARVYVGTKLSVLEDQIAGKVGAFVAAHTRSPGDVSMSWERHHAEMTPYKKVADGLADIVSIFTPTVARPEGAQQAEAERGPATPARKRTQVFQYWALQDKAMLERIQAVHAGVMALANHHESECAATCGGMHPANSRYWEQEAQDSGEAATWWVEQVPEFGGRAARYAEYAEQLALRLDPDVLQNMEHEFFGPK
jgi:hypothetical protein